LEATKNTVDEVLRGKISRFDSGGVEKEREGVEPGRGDGVAFCGQLVDVQQRF
jgi:hypothetical protein